MRIGYSRCSTAGQQHASQLDALERAKCDKIFIETASGAQADRPELRKLLEFARPGDTLCILRLDRLGRDVRQILSIIDELGKREIGLESLSEAIDTASPAGRLAVNVLASMSQFELEQKRPACAAGRRAAIARGRSGGRPRSLDETKLRIAKALMADGHLSMNEIAAQVGVAPSTLYRCVPGGRGGLLEASHAPALLSHADDEDHPLLKREAA